MAVPVRERLFNINNQMGGDESWKIFLMLSLEACF